MRTRAGWISGPFAGSTVFWRNSFPWSIKTWKKRSSAKPPFYTAGKGPGPLLTSTAPAESAAPSTNVDGRTCHIATSALGAYNYTLYAGVSDLIEKAYPGKYTISLDAGFYSRPHPLSSLTDLAVTSGMRLLNVGEELVDNIIEKYPFMHKVVIPAGTYPGIDEDIVTFTAYTCWIANASVPEQTVYEWLTVIMNDPADLEAIHPNAKNIKLETALIDQNIPLHPGALKFYKEKGLITEDPCANVVPAK